MRILLTCALFFSFTAVCGAADECQTPSFDPGQTQLEPKPVTVQAIRGYVDDGKARVNDVACVRVFREATKEFVSGVHTDSNGAYSLSVPSAGDYRVVVSYDSFCTISFGVHLRKTGSRKDIVVHLIPRGIDSCSWNELK